MNKDIEDIRIEYRKVADITEKYFKGEISLSTMRRMLYAVEGSNGI